MIYFLLSIHFVLAIAIVGIVLLQKHDSDGALGSSGGGAASGVFSVRGQANFLTRSTAIMMSLFVVNCLVMAKILKHTVAPKESLIDAVARESANNPNIASEKNSIAGKVPATKNAAGASTAGGKTAGKKSTTKDNSGSKDARVGAAMPVGKIADKSRSPAATASDAAAANGTAAGGVTENWKNKDTAQSGKTFDKGKK
ncbi:MAG: preprotein translocase subunit SecG [Holosporaceae bacterium]|jgi:preprotein translocase subunit SecG|nr:preprotein translocase subunit SecG [Holosporaceae bacterium]